MTNLKANELEMLQHFSATFESYIIAKC